MSSGPPPSSLPPQQEQQQQPQPGLPSRTNTMSAGELHASNPAQRPLAGHPGPHPGFPPTMRPQQPPMSASSMPPGSLAGPPGPGYGGPRPQQPAGIRPLSPPGGPRPAMQHQDSFRPPPLQPQLSQQMQQPGFPQSGPPGPRPMGGMAPRPGMPPQSLSASTLGPHPVRPGGPQQLGTSSPQQRMPYQQQSLPNLGPSVSNPSLQAPAFPPQFSQQQQHLPSPHQQGAPIVNGNASFGQPPLQNSQPSPFGTSPPAAQSGVPYPGSLQPQVGPLTNQMGAMSIGGGARSTRAKRVYTTSPTGGQDPQLMGGPGPALGTGLSPHMTSPVAGVPGHTPAYGSQMAGGLSNASTQGGMLGSHNTANMQPGMSSPPGPPGAHQAMYGQQSGHSLSYGQLPNAPNQPFPNQPGAQVGAIPQYGSQANMQPPVQLGMQPGMHGPQTGMGHANMHPQQPAGQSRSRIDPNQVPSPIVVQEMDQAVYENATFSTTSQSVPPLVSTNFRATDDGNCNPRFLRLTTYNIPCTEELANVTAVPLGVIIQPLAMLNYDEEPVEVVDFGEAGPIRCNRCKAYINPYFKFMEGGSKFMCNLCEFVNEVPPEYFMNLDMSGRRQDISRRPELRKGTVEFVATKEYCAHPAKPASYVLAIDVSWNAIQSGMLTAAIHGIRELLLDDSSQSLPPGTKVGIITFDKSVHFYNLKPTLEQPQMLVVPDVGDMFVPLNEGFLVDPKESRAVIENLLDTLPTIFEGNRTSEPALGAAVQAAQAALVGYGGKLTIFQTMLPTFGPGALKSREDQKLLGSEKEYTLYEPQEYFWKKVAQDCAQSGICVDMFLFPSAYIDVATIGTLTAVTGGDTYMYPNFEAARDGLRLIEDFKRSLTRPFGYDALLRVRVSNGLKVAEHFGNFYMKNSTDIELAGLSSESAIGAAIRHDGKLDEKSESAFQAALLYTTSTGQRRIRVHNLSVPNTSLLGNVFRFAEMDTTINYLMKAAVAQSAQSSLKSVRDRLSEKCVKILAAYRKHAASSSSPGQLILPESFKLYALYTLCMLKMRAFRGGAESSSDIRVHNMRLLKALGVRESVPLLYPRLLPLSDLPPEVGERDARGRIKLPPCIRASQERLNPSSAYAIENGQTLMLWLGRGISPEYVRAIFGVDSLEAIDPKMRALPVQNNPTSEKLRAMFSQLQADRPRYLHFQLVRQQMDQFHEVEFHNMLVEDQNYDNMTYVDSLVAVHRQIQAELSSSH